MNTDRDAEEAAREILALRGKGRLVVGGKLAEQVATAYLVAANGCRNGNDCPLPNTQCEWPDCSPKAPVDYTAMSGPELLDALRDDGAKWAAAFCQSAKKLGHGDIDESWVAGWFANAIEHSHDVRSGGGSVVLPDGSAFFVGEVK